MRASSKLPDAAAQIAAIVSNSSGTPVFNSAEDNVSISYIGTTSDNSWKGGTLNDNDGGEFDREGPLKR